MKIRMQLLLLFLMLLLAEHLAAISVTSKNATEALLKCPPAEHFIRTHMAPDFETPRLVRRLDWFQDDALVASYQQEILADSSRQWWVADGRYQLIRPFYTLRVSPVTPEDSGTYRCRIETDPLFSSPQSTATQELAVMVRPVAPSSPEIKSFTNRSITLIWTHNAARAHRPILRFSVSVRTVADNTRFVMAAPSNATTVIVDNLSPYTLYAFAVRAENSAGTSDFGPETTFRTLGEAPNRAPQIQQIRNVTSECVELTVNPPDEMNGELEKYLVLVQALNETEPRRMVFDKPTSTPLTICALMPSSQYALAVEADNGFGTSPQATLVFRTEDSVPNWSPSTITTLPVVGKPEITVLWPAPPLNATEAVTKYHLYYKANNEDQWKIEHLSVNKNGVKSKMFKYRLVDLNPNTLYRIRVSASTAKGEGAQSSDSLARTDVGEPGTVTFKDLNFDCKNGVKLSWNYEPTVNSKKAPTFTVKVTNRTTSLQFNTTMLSLDIIDLSLYDEYTLRIMVLERSTIDNSTILIGKYSDSHRFILKDKCSYQSSFCSPGEKCAKLTSSGENPRYISILIVVFAIILFVFICFVIAHFARGSMNFKHLLKKKEKCVYLEEISPLVYESTGQEDIPVELFYGYVEDLRRNDGVKFKNQFQLLENQTSGIDCTDSSESSTSEENSQKNRYNNIGAMEATRIRLNSPSGNDYINANYVDSCNQRNAYIATQAPLPSTFADFWSMIWQERSNVIVCITNMVEDGKRKCDQYWPSLPETPLNFGAYQVSLVSESTNAHFAHRILDLKIHKSVPSAERKIHQLHFMGWPDHGVPDSVMPLLNFIHYTSDIHSTGPVVVHCSAGVGRSGSYILVDSIRKHLISFRRLNVLGHLTHMRRQRAKLVQTLEQYMFCHEAIRQLIRHGITRVHSDLFMRYLHYLSDENLNGKSRMQLQFEDVCECHHQPRCQFDTDVITLPGYHRSDEFMVGTWRNETEELWRLAWQRKVQTIVCLNQRDAFWRKLPSTSDDVQIQHGDNFVLLQKEEQQLCIRIVNVSRADLEADFWREIENVQKQRLTYHDSPLLILAHKYAPNPSSPTDSTSTLSLSMLFSDDTSLAFSICAATTLACQLETTGCVDVVQVLSAYSQRQCGIFSSKQEIEIIYEKISQLVGGTRV